MSDRKPDALPIPAATPFDRQALEYDARFSDRLPARWLRNNVRRRVVPLVAPGDGVVEIGCGTGLDAAWLAASGCRVLATDASVEMLAVARARKLPDEVAIRIRWARVDASRSADLLALSSTGTPAKLAFSNFGALNCVRDLAPLFESLLPLLRHDGYVAVVLMGRFCLWESARFAARGRWSDMRRRWGGSSRYADAAGAVDVWYHSPAAVMRAARGFEQVALYGIGALLPPSEGFGVSERWPRLFSRLAAADFVLAPLLHPFSDHYLLVMKPRT